MSVEAEAWTALFETAREALPALNRMDVVRRQLDAAVAAVAGLREWPTAPSSVSTPVARAIAAFDEAADALEALPDVLRPQSNGLLFVAPTVTPSSLRNAARHVERVATAVGVALREEDES